jgi:lipopolysaccharide/colanic/teichoic acid biosynthesis glycosyltransferase
VEAAAALLGLLLAAPILLPAAVAVAVGSPGGVLFRQRRVGRGGRPFTLLKLRSMRTGTPGLQVTAASDRRITPVGRILRRTKVDELPELWNVVRGDMSLVGPRPEVPRYVDLDDPRWRRVLAARPGLTDPTTLELRNEEALLSGVEGDRDRFYAEVLLPYKLAGYLRYLERRSPWSDLAVLWRTAWAVVFPRRATPPSLEEIRRRSSELHLGVGESGADATDSR